MNLVRILMPRFRVLDAQMRLREEFYALSRADRQQYRLEQLNARWAEALKGSVYYSSLAARCDLPPRFDSLEQFRQIVPTTPRHPVRQAPKDFHFPGHHRGRWMLTGGSTGVPVRVFWSLPGHLQSLRDQYWARSWWGVGPFDRQAMLWGHSRSFGLGLRGAWHRLKVPLLDRLRNRRRFSAYKLDTPTLEAYFRAIMQYRPVSLYAYPSAAYLLALANAGKPPLPSTIKAAFLAAEPLLPVHRKLIEQVFCCPAVGEYGSIECGILAHEHPSGGYRVMEQNVLLETVAGEQGYSIVVTQLRPTAFPLFRYELGDQTSQPLMCDPQANDIEILREVSGRIQDVFRSPSGGVFYGGALTCILEEVPGIAMFSVIQRKDYSVDAFLQTKELADHHREWILAQFHQLLGRGVEVRIHLVDQIRRTSAGKLRWIISELP